MSNPPGIGDPEPAMFAVDLPHYLPQIYSEIPDEFHPDAVEVLICDKCQSEFPEKLALARKHLAELAVDAETDVSGYFQVSTLSQFTHLRKILAVLQDEPSVAIIRRLRADGLRWHIDSLKKGRAQKYQQEARKYGFEFIITERDDRLQTKV